MAGGAQISGLHLAIAAGGGLLLYAALRGVSPVQALKDVASGAPPAVETEGSTISGSDHQPGGEGGTDWKGVYKKRASLSMFQRPSVFIAALNAHSSEEYSQEKRWKKGHSDCSSFVGKGLLDIGITPPGGSTTGDYLSSKDWVTVKDPQMGDIAVSAKHMAVFTDGSAGIGQQNPRRNVHRDTMDNLMANTGKYVVRRWKGWA